MHFIEQFDLKHEINTPKYYGGIMKVIDFDLFIRSVTTINIQCDDKVTYNKCDNGSEYKLQFIYPNTNCFTIKRKDSFIKLKNNESCEFIFTLVKHIAADIEIDYETNKITFCYVASNVVVGEYTIDLQSNIDELKSVLNKIETIMDKYDKEFIPTLILKPMQMKLRDFMLMRRNIEDEYYYTEPINELNRQRKEKLLTYINGNIINVWTEMGMCFYVKKINEDEVVISHNPKFNDLVGTFKIEHIKLLINNF